jgi:hypothetical protein
MVAMAAGGMAYNHFVEKPRQERMNAANGAAAATQTQFSPWTKMGAGQADIQAPKSTIGAGMQGAMTGLSMQQQFDQANMNKQMGEQQLNMNKMNMSQPQYTQQNASGYDSFNPYAQKMKNPNQMMA